MTLKKDIEQIIAELAAPFDVDDVKWRVGNRSRDKKTGRALAYVDARCVMSRLDDVLGANNWQNRYTHVLGGVGAVCEIGISVDGEWLWKSNGADPSNMEGFKGSMSDSFKRAATLWGVGRYLYDIESPEVELSNEKWIANKENDRLRAIVMEISGGNKSDNKAKKDARARAALFYNNALTNVVESEKPTDWLAKNSNKVNRLKEFNEEWYYDISEVYFNETGKMLYEVEGYSR